MKTAPYSKIKKVGMAGFGLAEMIVMIFITTFSLLIVWKIYAFFTKISFSNPALFQASFLAEEGIEAVKFMRDGGWSSNIAPLSTTTPYTLVFNGLTWGVSATPAYIDGKFDRQVSLSDVYRDASGNIVPAGSFDPNTKKVVVTVSWQKDTGTTTREITTYVANIFNN